LEDVQHGVAARAGARPATHIARRLPRDSTASASTHSGLSFRLRGGGTGNSRAAEQAVYIAHPQQADGAIAQEGDWRRGKTTYLGMWKYMSLCSSERAQKPSPICGPAFGLLKCFLYLSGLE